MRDKNLPPRMPRRHAGVRRTDSIGNQDRAGVGRKGGADIDVDRREKELERPR